MGYDSVAIAPGDRVRFGERTAIAIRPGAGFWLLSDLPDLTPNLAISDSALTVIEQAVVVVAPAPVQFAPPPPAPRRTRKEARP